MVNGLILAKFDKQINVIENTLAKYLNKFVNSIQKFSELKRIEKPIEDPTKIKIIRSIKTLHTKGIRSMCELKDKRLVSSSLDQSIIVYDHSYEPQICIKNAHESYIWSLCVLKNGLLASSSNDKAIKIWQINEGYHKLSATLKGHSNSVNKVIELEDGRLCSCSADGTIKIWENFECVRTLTGRSVESIIEVNRLIISGSADKRLRIWEESRYECINVIGDVYCWSNNSLSKLNDKILLIGGDNTIYSVDIETYKVNKTEDNSFGKIFCLNVLRNGLVLFGNEFGEISSFDLASNKINFKSRFHKENEKVFCLIETEDNKLVSSSSDKTINVYH